MEFCHRKLFSLQKLQKNKGKTYFYMKLEKSWNQQQKTGKRQLLLPISRS